MHIIITGSKGQLGKTLEKLLPEYHPDSIVLIDKEELDITDSTATERFFRNHKCDLLINCAAYTAVDDAESNVQAAMNINRDGIRNLAHESAAHDFKILHISTDYVFSGDGNRPYREDDLPAPNTVYGETKLSGEKILMSIQPRAIIIRTAWLYSPYGKNFFLTMARRAKEKMVTNVVSDQKGTPTNAEDLAKAILEIIFSNDWKPGIYHFTNEGECSWYEFARAIFKMHGASQSLVNPILSSQYPSKADRPKYSVLDTSKIKKTFRLDIPDWEKSLEKLRP